MNTSLLNLITWLEETPGLIYRLTDDEDGTVVVSSKNNPHLFSAITGSRHLNFGRGPVYYLGGDENDWFWERFLKLFRLNSLNGMDEMISEMINDA